MDDLKLVKETWAKRPGGDEILRSGQLLRLACPPQFPFAPIRPSDAVCDVEMQVCEYKLERQTGDFGQRRIVVKGRHKGDWHVVDHEAVD